jgi:VanZ family protein
MVVIFVLSSIPDIGALPGGATDKSWHAIGYGALGVFLLLPLADGRLAGATWRRALAAIALAILYGMSDELHQAVVPGRSPDMHDLMADAAGAAGAVTVVWLTAAARAWGILRFSSHPANRDTEEGQSRGTAPLDGP